MIHSVQMARLNKAIGSDFEIESLEGMFFLFSYRTALFK